MNTPDKKSQKNKDISKNVSENDEATSALDTFPMKAALGIYTMNQHTETIKRNDS